MTLDALLARAHHRGLHIPADLLRDWLVSLVERGLLVEVSPDDFELTARGRRHFWASRELTLEDYGPVAPIGAAWRRERRVEEDG